MNTKNADRIVFHWLPPATPLSPSSSFSVLGSFLKGNGIGSSIIYWNNILDPYYLYYFKESENLPEEAFLLPFLGFLTGESSISENMKARIVNRIAAFNSEGWVRAPDTDLSGFFRMSEGLMKTIDKKISEQDFSNIEYIGFSSRYFQWIPAIKIIRSIRARYPGIKTIIGGFSNRLAAETLLRKCKEFDYAVWGEGEYPLLDLINHNSVQQIGTIPGVLVNGITIEGSNEPRKYACVNEITHNLDSYFDSLGMVSYRDSVCIPLELTRGCNWNRCKFCSLNQGYLYRKISSINIRESIVAYDEKYHIGRFSFLDNDIVGDDQEAFEELLDALIDASLEVGRPLTMNAEVIHLNMSEKLISKMAIAGFTRVQIGVESLSDSQLQKMNKRTSFIDTLFFFRTAHRYGIAVSGANIIRGLPDETIQDIFESTQNLHYLRFLIGKIPNSTKLRFTQLSLGYNSRYYKEVKKEDIENWNYHYLLDFSNDLDLIVHLRASEGLIKRDYPMLKEWELFENTYNAYKNATYCYYILPDGDCFTYKEELNGTIIKCIYFDKPIYMSILKEASSRTICVDDLMQLDRIKYESLSSVQDALMDMLDEGLLFMDKRTNRITAVIDFP